ncbi:hypothetical protein GCM10007884_51580 [Methylobacterium brachythecii]|uniref:Uncharacterized protein n=1 Tax=Methylobacterium brachythecii TaxID=1176177 RepID=A0ABQ6DCC1_9HYPH|nr:hypothetical protein GCM10007884_51580 [Methylobacterium brachythecii]
MASPLIIFTQTNSQIRVRIVCNLRLTNPKVINITHTSYNTNTELRKHIIEFRLNMV